MNYIFLCNLTFDSFSAVNTKVKSLLGFRTTHNVNNFILQNGSILNLNELEQPPKCKRSRRYFLSEAVIPMLQANVYHHLQTTEWSKRSYIWWLLQTKFFKGEFTHSPHLFKVGQTLILRWAIIFQSWKQISGILIV